MATKKKEVIEEAPKKKTVKKAVKPEIKLKDPAEAVWIYHTGDDLDVISFNLTGKKYMIYRILQYSGINMNQLKDGDVLKWGI